jgi:DNA-directed RNA polymerase specialized sigma24 family protein
MPNKDQQDTGTPSTPACQEDDELRPRSAVRGKGPLSGEVSSWPHVPYIRDAPLPPELVAKSEACIAAITDNKDIVPDLMQQVREKLLKMSREQWDAVERKPGLVIRIAQNASCDWLKKSRRGERTYQDTKNWSCMNSEQKTLEGKPVSPKGSGWDLQELIRVFKPLGRERAQAYIRVRFYNRSISGTALKMKIPVSRVLEHLDYVELYFAKQLEGGVEWPSLRARLANLFKRGQS